MGALFIVSYVGGYLNLSTGLFVSYRYFSYLYGLFNCSYTEQIKIVSESGHINIIIPWELLVFATENNPNYSIKIIDKEKFIEKVRFGLENYSDRNDIEIGITHLQQCIDNIILDIYEDGEDCLK